MPALPCTGTTGPPCCPSCWYRAVPLLAGAGAGRDRYGEWEKSFLFLLASDGFVSSAESWVLFHWSYTNFCPGNRSHTSSEPCPPSGPVLSGLGHLGTLHIDFLWCNPLPLYGLFGQDTEWFLLSPVSGGFSFQSMRNKSTPQVLNICKRLTQLQSPSSSPR